MTAVVNEILQPADRGKGTHTPTTSFKSPKRTAVCYGVVTIRPMAPSAIIVVNNRTNKRRCTSVHARHTAATFPDEGIGNMLATIL